MIKKTIEFESFEGVKEKKDYYFHLSKTDLIGFASGTKDGDIQSYIERIKEEKDTREIWSMFRDIISMSYGIKDSKDGSFYKDDIETKKFLASPAFDELILELIKDAEKAAEFIANLLPSDIRPSRDELGEALNQDPLPLD